MNGRVEADEEEFARRQQQTDTGVVSKFLDYLDTRVIDPVANDGGGLHQLLGPLRYQSQHLAWLNLPEFPGGIVLIPAGFVTDFASVPRLPVAYGYVGNIGHGPAVVHDWLYVTGLLPKENADYIFYEALVVWGVDRPRAKLMWDGVHLFGHQHYATNGRGHKPELAPIFPPVACECL